MTNQEIRIAAARGLFAQQGVMVSMPDLNSNGVAFRHWRIPTDVLVGELQRAGELTLAVLCATHKLEVSYHGQMAKPLNVEANDLPLGASVELLDDVRQSLESFAVKYVEDAEYGVQWIFGRAQQALQRSPAHRNRFHSLGASQAKANVLDDRDLGEWLSQYPQPQHVERLVRLASSPFRHLRVRVTIERRRRNYWERGPWQVVEVHVPAEKPIPASRLIRQVRGKHRQTNHPTAKEA